eukprot:SAG31_NODE_23059_length_512_cov_0.910412_1_plen_121_part_00
MEKLTAAMLYQTRVTQDAAVQWETPRGPPPQANASSTEQPARPAIVPDICAVAPEPTTSADAGAQCQSDSVGDSPSALLSEIAGVRVQQEPMLYPYTREKVAPGGRLFNASKGVRLSRAQ